MGRQGQIVSNDLLLIKLEAYGFRWNLLRGIKTFLTNRKQRTVYEDQELSLATVLSGVLQ